MAVTLDRGGFRTLARNWEALGETDPMFGVLSDPTKFGGKWSVDEFFETGRAHVHNLFRILNARHVAFDRGRCLDFGCGVGRLTIPLAESFEHTIGVDVARSMIEPARRHRRPHDPVEFVVNTDQDLRRFPTSTFDFVHSCLVLQHIPPQLAVGYVAEFLRVTKPGGLVVFQLPARTRTEAMVSAIHALPATACAAEILVVDAPAALQAGEHATLRMAVTNNGTAPWGEGIPASRRICIGNHWLAEDGAMVAADDGRAPVRGRIGVRETFEVSLEVQAPATPGRYRIEIDLVQERICWFAERGSRTVNVPVTVSGATTGLRSGGSRQSTPEPMSPSSPRPGRRRETPRFEMHVVLPQEVEHVVRTHGGDTLHAIDDNAAGERWISYTYVCRKNRPRV
jgi:SAM-dependent methyltransferase